jgi:hypothetical protein
MLDAMSNAELARTLDLDEATLIEFAKTIAQDPRPQTRHATLSLLREAWVTGGLEHPKHRSGLQSRFGR